MKVVWSSNPCVIRWFSCIRDIFPQKYDLDIIVVIGCIELINLKSETILRVTITISLDELPQLISGREIKLCELKNIL